MRAAGRLDGQGVPLNFFADVHVRRAFNACFDRSAFITDTLAGQWRSAAGDHIARSAGLCQYARRWISIWQSALKNSRRPNSRPKTISRCGMWALR